MSNKLVVIEENPIEGEIINLPLSEEEQKEHIACVSRILEAFQGVTRTMLQVWKDLKWIKDNRTYRVKYDTFNEFCRVELARDNSQVYRYLKDAEFKETLLLEADTDEERLSILSLKESNTRQIRLLSSEEQIPFWKLVYGFGGIVLNKKEDGSIEPTTGFLQAVGDKIEEATTLGGIHLDGEFISFDGAQHAADLAGTTPEQAKALLIGLGVSEDYFEVLKRQAQHIKEKSIKADIVTQKGTVEVRQDVNGSDYPVIVDSKGNEIDMSEVLLAFNNRFVHFSLKSPIREI